MTVYATATRAKDSHPMPSQTITPICSVETISNGYRAFETHYTIETRGNDGSFSRCYGMKVEKEVRV